jgi:hypothetical protein
MLDPADQPGHRAWALPDSPSGDADSPAVPVIDGLTVDPAADEVGRPAAGGEGDDTDAASADVVSPRLPVPLRPLTVSDVLDGSFAIIKARPRTVVLLAAATVVPAQLIGSFLARGQTSVTDLLSVTADPNAFGTAGSGTAPVDLVGPYVGAMLEALSLFFLGGAMGALVAAWYGGRDLRAGAALKASYRRAPAFLAAFFMLLPLKVISYVLEIVPVFATITLFALTAPVMVIERLGPIAGPKRSVLLITRRFFPSLWIIVLSTLVTQIIGPLLALIPEVASFLVPEDWRWVLQGIGRSAVSLLLAPFAAGVCILLYLDLRVRTEGLDIELAATDAFTERAAR